MGTAHRQLSAPAVRRLLLEAYGAGRTVDVSAARALGTVALYAVVAAAVASIVFSRRDVTA